MRYLSLLAVLAFLFSTMLPFYASYNISNTKNSAQAGELSSLFGDKILICTADGFKWVSLKDIEDGEAPESHPQFKCPICFISADGNNHSSPLNLAELSFTYKIYDISYDSSYNNKSIQKFLNSNHQTRAPPIFFVS